MAMDDDNNNNNNMIVPPNNDDTLRLSLSHEDTNPDGAGISFGDEDSTEANKSNKRKKSISSFEGEDIDKPKAKTKRKKRKIVTDFGQTELPSDHIRRMLADTSALVQEQVHPATWVPGCGVALGLSDRQLLRQHLSVEQLLQRPALADDGQLAPELLKVWYRNAAPIRGEKVPFKMQTENDMNNETLSQENVEQTRKADETDDNLPIPEDESNEMQGEEYPLPDDVDTGIPFDDTDDQIVMQEDGDSVMGVDSK